jgi:hypothetical protein
MAPHRGPLHHLIITVSSVERSSPFCSSMFRYLSYELAGSSHGPDVNARAEADPEGFGGQTPVFHAVNSMLDYCRPVIELLVEAGADLGVRLKGVVWGPGQDWEALVLDVTPLSYAQCGLYAQFHRREADVYGNLRYLFKARRDRAEASGGREGGGLGRGSPGSNRGGRVSGSQTPENQVREVDQRRMDRVDLCLGQPSAR